MTNISCFKLYIKIIFVETTKTTMEIALDRFIKGLKNKGIKTLAKYSFISY